MNQQEKTASSPSEAQPLTARPFPFQMTDVRLVKVHAEIREADTDEEEETVQAPIRIVILSDEDESYEEFDLALLFEIQSEISEGEVTLRLFVIIEGHFKAIVDPETIDQAVARRFKESEVVTLLWPYMRETVHNITERMCLDLPPLPIVDARYLVSIEPEE